MHKAMDSLPQFLSDVVLERVLLFVWLTTITIYMVSGLNLC